MTHLTHCVSAAERTLTRYINFLKMWGIPCMFLLFSLFGTIIAAVPYVDFNTKNNIERNEVSGFSQSEIVANFIIKSINKSADPCKDFHEYACGNWQKNFPRPGNQIIWDMDKIAEKTMNIRLREILEEEIKPDDSIPLQYEKEWYQSCTNLAKREKDGIKHLEHMLDQLGGWPITMRSHDESDNSNIWQNVHNYYIDYNEINALFEIGVSNDIRNTSKFIILIGQPTDTLYEDMLKDENVEKSLKKYEEFMKKVALVFAKSINSEVSSEDVVNDVKAVINFEEKLHSIKLSVDERDDDEYGKNYMKIKDFQTFYDQKNHKSNTSKINWLQTIANIFKKVNITIDDSEEINVVDISYFEKLSGLLDETPNRVIVNYIHWEFLIYSLESTTREMIDLVVEGVLEHSGYQEEPENWISCLSDLKPRYGLRLKYVKKYFSEDLKKMGLEMADKIRDKLMDDIQKSSWLDQSTKSKTLKKINKLTINMGYTNILNNATFMEHIYDEFQLGQSYCESLQNYKKYEIEKNLNRLRTIDEKISENDLLMDPLIPNAIYQFYMNTLFVTAAQLSTPFFEASLPMSVNYGYIGSVIGHELSHAMDSSGRSYDEYGNNKPWWPESMVEEYEKKSQCFVEQFNNYSLNGKIALGENMADTIGVELSYKAFKEIADGSSSAEMKLPGLEEITSDQLFFLSFALSYCQTTSPNFWLQNADSGYSPNKYRIIGTVSNSEAFAKAYKCPANTPMNPKRKCYLW